MQNDVSVIYRDEVIFIEWRIPRVYHTRAFIEQCRDDVIDASACIEHDVTMDYSGGLTVNRLNGTSLSLVVYQDRDEVVRLRLAQDEKSKNNSG